MAKAPLKQLSVNTFESNSIALSKPPAKKSGPVIIDAPIVKKKHVVHKQPTLNEKPSVDIPSMVQAGSRMSSDDFESFVQKTAPDSYWHIMAEHYRSKLEEVTRENQQLHEMVEELNKDNENLRTVADHCEYLTDIIEKLTSETENEGTKKSSVCVRLF